MTVYGLINLRFKVLLKGQTIVLYIVHSTTRYWGGSTDYQSSTFTTRLYLPYFWYTHLVYNCNIIFRAQQLRLNSNGSWTSDLLNSSSVLYSLTNHCLCIKVCRSVTFFCNLVILCHFYISNPGFIMLRAAMGAGIRTPEHSEEQILFKPVKPIQKVFVLFYLYSLTPVAVIAPQSKSGCMI